MFTRNPPPPFNSTAGLNICPGKSSCLTPFMAVCCACHFANNIREHTTGEQLELVFLQPLQPQAQPVSQAGGALSLHWSYQVVVSVYFFPACKYFILLCHRTTAAHTISKVSCNVGCFVNNDKYGAEWFKIHKSPH